MATDPAPERSVSRPKVVVASLAVDLVLRALSHVVRVRDLTPDATRELATVAPPGVMLLWHHQLVMLTACGPRILLRDGLRISILISRSKDGDIGQRLGEARGLRVVRGSSSRGGAAALRQLARELVEERRHVVVVPDGPRGPARQVKDGAVTLAALAGVPIRPIALVAGRAWRLGSWDRTVVPKPLSPIGFAVGDAVAVPRRADEGERARILADLTARLDGLEAWAHDRIGGRRDRGAAAGAAPTVEKGNDI